VGLPFPAYPGGTSDGDERTDSPKKTTPSLLASERGTDYTRRLETDTERNLYVHVAEDSSAAGLVVTALAAGATTNLADSILTTLVTYTAPAGGKRISKIEAGGTLYAKYQMFINTVLVATRRSGPDRYVVFDFSSPYSLAASDILDVKVTHYNTGTAGDFESSVFGG
jgi:hypothetical protein